MTEITDDLFVLPDVWEWRGLQGRRIAEVLGSHLDAPTESASAMTYAAAHHLLEGAEQSARDREPQKFAWYRRAELRDLAPLLAGPTASPCLALAPKQEELLRSSI